MRLASKAAGTTSGQGRRSCSLAPTLRLAADASAAAAVAALRVRDASLCRRLVDSRERPARRQAAKRIFATEAGAGNGEKTGGMQWAAAALTVVEGAD
mmetsp:Transcript_36259/g.91286  ORF Transcript_36259/g.91286 Transcript_36259/m.91286 type:complete len:98 (-) Transcript_36259:642-935(-)